MLTIGQLASYAGVTVRAVRHYHQIGLLPEPARDHSGYRCYAAAAVVRLIQIRTLAEAGVPLARVQQLLAAGPEEFADAVAAIDQDLHAEIERLQANRDRIARLAAGDSLALPPSVVDYLDQLRALGVDERYIVLERDAWIMLAARLPHRIESVIADKQRELADPDVLRLYRLLSQALDWPAGDPRLSDIVDLLESAFIRAEQAGQLRSDDDFDAPFVELMDALTAESSPIAQQILIRLEQRGWQGWTRIERRHSLASAPP